jgi:hypothetical protein
MNIQDQSFLQILNVQSVVTPQKILNRFTSKNDFSDCCTCAE